MEEKRPFREWLIPRSKEDQQQLEADMRSLLKYSDRKWNSLNESGWFSPQDLLQETIEKILRAPIARQPIDRNHFRNLIKSNIGKKGVDFREKITQFLSIIKPGGLDILNEPHRKQKLYPSPEEVLEEILALQKNEELLNRFPNDLEKLDYELFRIYNLKIQGLKQTEIAKQLGYSDATINRRIEKLLNLMIEFARKEGLINE